MPDPVRPEDCLRSLAAEALLCAPHQPLFPESLGLMAVANAFVMLGLLPEPRAEAVLADHKSALEREGKPAWFELAPTTAGTSGRVALLSPAQVRVGRSDLPWPTRPRATWPRSRRSPPFRSEPSAP